jgi:transposase
MPTPHWKMEFQEKVRKEYEAGDDLRTIAARYDTSKSTIRRYIVAAGGQMRPQGSPHPKRAKTGLLAWLDS